MYVERKRKVGKKKGKEIKETGTYIEWGNDYDVNEEIEFVFNDRRSWLDRLLHGDKDYSNEAYELMWKHQEFYRQVREAEAEYAERGAVLWCTHGSKPTKLDECTGHGVSVNGNEVMTCNSNTVDENIFSFGACGNGLYEPLYSEEAPYPAELAKDGIHYRCVPILLREWGYGGINERSDKPGVYIAEPRIDAPQLEGYLQHDDEYVEALLTEYNLLCLYGGVITIEENPEQEENILPIQEFARYVVIPKIMIVRKEPNTKSDEILRLEAGQRIDVILNGGQRIEENNLVESRLWVEIKLDDDTIGWVADENILPDALIETVPPKEVNVKVFGKDDKTLYPSENWGIVGAGDYINDPMKVITEDKIERYRIAVAPRILNPKYGKDGLVQMDDFMAFNMFVELDVENKITLKIDTKYCFVVDIKAHSYNKYPDGHTGNSNIVSAESDVESGIVQTGIRYPKAVNPLIVAIDNIDGTIIEFCTGSLDFNPNDYRLLKVTAHLKEV